jgi:soluble lytic murein transglycosylase
MLGLLALMGSATVVPAVAHVDGKAHGDAKAHVDAARPMLEPKDRQVVAEAFRAADGDEWARAFRLLAPVADPLPAKTLRWLRMIRDGEPADFATLASFLLTNPDWPLAERLQIIAEGTINDPADHALIRRFFRDRPPLTTRGHIRYAEALFRIDDTDRASRLIRTAWIDGDFSSREESRFLEKFKKLLTTDDHVARLDNLLWDHRRRSASRMLQRVPKDLAKLAKARLDLQRRRGGVDRSIAAVPTRLRRDSGLVFDRLRWRRQKRRHDSVVELLLDPPPALARPAAWWFERELQIRRALRKRDFDLAYRLASRHGQTAGDDFAEAEWLAGWLALRFGRRPNTAIRHFERLYGSVEAPVEMARGAYWLARSAAALGDDVQAAEWYQKAARHQHAYYGQLAAVELGDAFQPPAPVAAAGPGVRAAFEGRELVRVATMLIETGALRALVPFLIHLTDLAADPAEVGLVAALAATSGRPHLVTRLGRYAAYYGKVNTAAAFPIPDLEALLEPREDGAEAALVLGVGRQESLFNSWVSSHAGASGLLQLMPRTAELMARSLRLPYNRGLLTGKPAYNVRLGGHYLQRMLKRYGGEAALAVAAYNAGPRRVDGWLKLHGDPRKGDRHDLVDWIELVPFDETRNYVQRVLEGYGMYRRRLAEAEVETVWFRPINGPLDPLPDPTLKPIEVANAAFLVSVVANAPLPQLKPARRPRVLPAGFGRVPIPRLKPTVVELAAGRSPRTVAKPRPSS